MDTLLQEYFRYDDRIELWVPDFGDRWQTLELAAQSEIASVWNRLRGEIPEKIRALEATIMQLIEKMYTDVSFETFCQLNSDMIDLAATVNELNIWSRYMPSVTSHAGQGQTETMERAHF